MLLNIDSYICHAVYILFYIQTNQKTIQLWWENLVLGDS